MVKVLCVAGTHSGVGKTALTTGLLAALAQQSLRVQPFKVGPDFLDPLQHTAACGRPSINLDGYLMTREQVLASFHRHTADADVAIIEGVMGLFDSRDGASDDGSTAQIAKWLAAPVVLVVDASAMARSAAALVKGYTEFDAELRFAGVVPNKVGGAAHGAWLREALESAVTQGRLQQAVAVLGCTPKDASITVPERYMGLTMPHEQEAEPEGPQEQPDGASQQQQQRLPAYIARLAAHVSSHLDLDLLLRVAADVRPPAANGVPRVLSAPAVCRIAVARDQAFCFYYEDNLALLRTAGADLHFFSPLHDTALPPAISGLYLGGGYPERYCRQLAANASLRQAVRSFAAAGGVVYAECGGLIFLSQGFDASTLPSTELAGGSGCSDGGSGSGSQTALKLVPLGGVLPLVARMGRMQMGYCEVRVLPGNPVFPPGERVRGQMFHFSEVVQLPPGAAAAGAEEPAAAAPEPAAIRMAYELQQVLPGAQPCREGYTVGNVLASYVHLHFGGCPQLAAALVSRCASVGPVGSSSSSSSSAGASISAAAQQAAGAPSDANHPCCCVAADGTADATAAAPGAPAVTGSTKIVSLLPSGTEIVCALGLHDQLVGVSSFCDWPPEAAAKPRAVTSLIDVEAMSSDEVEAAMQGFKARGQSPFTINVGLLATERPGLVLTQDACPTCDAGSSLACKAVAEAGLSSSTTRVLVLQPKTLADMLDSISSIEAAAAAGSTARACELVAALTARLARVAAAVAQACPAAVPVTVACSSVARSLPQLQTAVSSSSSTHCQWRQARRVLSLEGFFDPLVLGGQWLPDVKLAAGAVDASGQQPGDAPARVSWEQVQGLAPDVLLLCPCSRSPAAAMPDVERLVALPGFGQLPAVVAEQVFLIDHAWFSRPGPRLVDGVELLATLLYGAEQQCGVACSNGPAVLRIKARGEGGFDWLPV